MFHRKGLSETFPSHRCWTILPASTRWGTNNMSTRLLSQHRHMISACPACPHLSSSGRSPHGATTPSCEALRTCPGSIRTRSETSTQRASTALHHPTCYMTPRSVLHIVHQLPPLRLWNQWESADFCTSISASRQKKYDHEQSNQTIWQATQGALPRYANEATINMPHFKFFSHFQTCTLAKTTPKTTWRRTPREGFHVHQFPPLRQRDQWESYNDKQPRLLTFWKKTSFVRTAFNP